VYTLYLLAPEGAVPLKVLTDAPANIGRGPANDVIVNDDTVSWHHAAFWIEGDAVWLRDTGSTNGTFINENRIRGAERLQPGDAIRLGTRVCVEVRGDTPRIGARRASAIEDAATGTRFPVRGDRFYFGSSPLSDIVMPGGDRVATLIVHDNEEIWLGTDDDERELKVGEPFEVNGRRFILRKVVEEHVPTQADDMGGSRYPYRLRVTLDGATGPSASVTETEAKSYRVDSGNRAILLYILAKRLREDITSDKPKEERGWCSDDEIKSGVWGRHGDDNKLHVLLYRLRNDLKKDGFDPWFIEKRQRFIRLRIAEVEVV
jgi:hypothetical protein